jgi:hypothetical protein
MIEDNAQVQRIKEIICPEGCDQEPCPDECVHVRQIQRILELIEQEVNK